MCRRCNLTRLNSFIISEKYPSNNTWSNIQVKDSKRKIYHNIVLLLNILSIFSKSITIFEKKKKNINLFKTTGILNNIGKIKQTKKKMR